MGFTVFVLLTAEALFALWLLNREGLLKKYSYFVTALILIALAFLLRAFVLPYKTLDYQDFLSRWVEFFRVNGGFKALGKPVGNYNVPYLYFLALFSYIPVNDLYLIKLLSILFDVLLAYGVMKLLSLFKKSPAVLIAAFISVLYLPTVFLNGAVWGQCDSIYAALALLGIYCALTDRPCLSMALAALSFGFKLQAVFILPVYAVLWFMGKFNWKHFLLFPLTYIVLVLPAVIMGRPFIETITLYFNQTGSIGSGLNYSSPSVFAILTGIKNEALASKLGIAAAFIFMLTVLGLALWKRKNLSRSSVMWAALLFTLGIPFLLPHMHERYFFAADIMCLLMSFAVPELAGAAVLCQFASLLGYHAYLKRAYLLTLNYGAWAIFLLLIIACVFYVFSLSKKNLKKSEKKC